MGDRLLQEIRELIAAEEYDSAETKCVVAINVYETIIQGFRECKDALDGIRDSACAMKGTADRAGSGLKDEVGSRIVSFTRESADRLIQICAGSDDEIGEKVRILVKRREIAQELRVIAHQLAEEKRRREQQQRSEGRSR